MTVVDDVLREFREFRRYTGDGLPGEPTNAPLPVGDPQSGPWNPKKANLRLALGNLAQEMLNSVAVINGAIPAITAAKNSALAEIATFLPSNFQLLRDQAVAALAQSNITRDETVLARNEARASRDASFALGPKYFTEAAGRAAVADGSTFIVIGGDGVSAIEYQRISAASSWPIARYPSAYAAGTLVPQISNWIYAEVDIDDRPIFVLTSDGRKFEARSGALVEVSTAGVIGATAIAAFGDSTTAGADLANPATERWTYLLSQSLGTPVTNKGSSGTRAEEITFREGSINLSAMVAGGTIPASGPVNLTGFEFSPLRSGPSSIPAGIVAPGGTIVAGTLALTGGNYVFTRSSSGSAIPAGQRVDVYSTDALGLLDQLVIVGMGVNNEDLIVDGSQSVSQVKAWYRAFTSKLKNEYIVWGLLDRGLSEAPGTAVGNFIATMESWLEETYGSRFVKVRRYLASARALDDAVLFNPSFVPTANDTAAIQAGVVPPSFRASSGTVHLNALGHQLQARLFARYLRSPLGNLI